MRSRATAIFTAAVVFAGAAYVVIGTVAPTAAGRGSPAAAVTAWRLVAWLLSLVVFGVHFVYERGRAPRRLTVAARVGIAVALGALGVAILGPVRSHWADPSRSKLIVLTIIAWPLLAGAPAFAAALIGGAVFDRICDSAAH